MTGVRRENPHREEDGFTLIELVVSVAILGIISAALFGTIFAYLKVSQKTASQLAESTDQQFVSAYWQADVSSLGNRALDTTTPAAPVPASTSVFKDPGGGCGSAAGAVVVRLEWVEFTVGADEITAWHTDPESVAYVLVGSSAPYRLERVRCDAGGAKTPIVVARMLVDKPTVLCDGSASCPTGTSLPEQMSMTLRVRDTEHLQSPGYTTVLTADRRQG